MQFLMPQLYVLLLADHHHGNGSFRVVRFARRHVALGDRIHTRHWLCARQPTRRGSSE